MFKKLKALFLTGLIGFSLVNSTQIKGTEIGYLVSVFIAPLSVLYDNINSKIYNRQKTSMDILVNNVLLLLGIYFEYKDNFKSARNQVPSLDKYCKIVHLGSLFATIFLGHKLFSNFSSIKNNNEKLLIFFKESLKSLTLSFISATIINKIREKINAQRRIVPPVNIQFVEEPTPVGAFQGQHYSMNELHEN